MVAMETSAVTQPLISFSLEGTAENLQEKLPYLRFWKELKANQQQGHVEGHERLGL